MDDQQAQEGTRTATRTAEAVANRTPAAAALSILLVEDHEDSLYAMTQLLRRLHHRVTPANSVRTAMSAAQSQRFDVLISDLGLPDGTGLQLMQWLLAQYPVRGIALTGFAGDQDVAQCRAAGFATHLTKPIMFSALEAALRGV